MGLRVLGRNIGSLQSLLTRSAALGPAACALNSETNSRASGLGYFEVADFTVLGFRVWSLGFLPGV